MTTASERTAAQILRDGGLSGRNFMTPSYIGDYKLDADSAAELSSGTGMRHEPIYGVTVVWHGERDYDRSTMFYSQAEAKAYIAGLREDLRIGAWTIDE